MLIRLGFMSSSFVSFEKNHTVETEDGNNTIVNIGALDVDLATWTWAQWLAFGP